MEQESQGKGEKRRGEERRGLEKNVKLSNKNLKSFSFLTVNKPFL